MKLEERLAICSKILSEYLPFISQLDQNVIENFDSRLQHQWIEQITKFSNDDIAKFDALRNYKLLQDQEWISLIEKIKEVSNFDSIKSEDYDFTSYGNKKKKHELSILYSYFLTKDVRDQNVVDFGGGVGNLAFFLENELGMNPLVLEKDPALVEKGKSRSNKESKKTTFKQVHIDQDCQINELNDQQIGIGLHTCGNFAVDMMNCCSENELEQIVNFGCCYSKIQNNRYNLSEHSNKELIFNQRALASATLAFGKTTIDIYNYRLKIQDFKFSFYNLVFNKYQLLRFFPMSNSRRSLYQLSFNDFFKNCLKKYYPNLNPISQSEVESFYQSTKNRELNQYFKVYYAISRYIGEVLEIYLLCDRALYLQSKGYTVEIKQFFDPSISPRNKAILAKRL